MATIGLKHIDQNDGPTCYQMARSISSNDEAAGKFFNFQIHERYPTLIHQ